MLEAVRFEDDDANENEFWLKVFSRILQKKKDTLESFIAFLFSP